MKILIAVVMLLALASPTHAASKGEWRLTFHITMCDRFGCDPNGPRSGGTYYADREDTEAYFTKKQCLAMRTYLTELFNQDTSYEDYKDDPLYKRALMPYSIAADETNGGSTKKVTSRCIRHH